MGGPQTLAGPGRGRSLAAVIGVSACASCASLAFAPLAPFLVRDLGIGYASVGALNAALFVGAAVASPHAGRWVDRVGFGPALTVGVAGMAVCFVLAFVAGSAYSGLLGAAILAGGAFALVNPAANIAVGRGFDPARRGTIMGVKQSGISLGGIAAGAWLPGAALVWGWRAALLQLAALLAVAALVSAKALGVPRGHRSRAAVAAPAQSGSTRVYALWTGGLLLSCPQAFLMTYLVLYVADAGSAGPRTAGWVYAGVQLAALSGRIALGAVTDVVYGGRRRAVLVAASVGGALAMLGLALLPPRQLAAVVAVAVLGGMTAIGWNGVYMAALVDAAPEEAAGAVSGIGVGLNLAAVVVFPLVAGALLDAGLGFRTLWLGAGAFAAAAAAAFLRTPNLAPSTPLIGRAAA